MAKNGDSFGQFVHDTAQAGFDHSKAASNCFGAWVNPILEKHMDAIGWGFIGLVAFAALIVIGRYGQATMKKEAAWKEHLSTVHGSAKLMTTNQLFDEGLAGLIAGGVILG